MANVNSPRGEVTYYLHDTGVTPDISGDQTAARYYWDTDSDDQAAVPSDYITVHNVLLDIPGMVPGNYIL